MLYISSHIKWKINLSRCKYKLCSLQEIEEIIVTEVSTGRVSEWLWILVYFLGPSGMNLFTLRVWTHEKLREINLCVYTCMWTCIHAVIECSQTTYTFSVNCTTVKRSFSKQLLYSDNSEGKNTFTVRLRYNRENKCQRKPAERVVGERAFLWNECSSPWEYKKKAYRTKYKLNCLGNTEDHQY